MTSQEKQKYMTMVNSPDREIVRLALTILMRELSWRDFKKLVHAKSLYFSNEDDDVMVLEKDKHYCLIGRVFIDCDYIQDSYSCKIIEI